MSSFIWVQDRVISLTLWFVIDGYYLSDWRAYFTVLLHHDDIGKADKVPQQKKSRMLCLVIWPNTYQLVTNTNRRNQSKKLGLDGRRIEEALTRRWPDRSRSGFVIRSPHFLGICQQSQVQVSVGSISDCYDNAVRSIFRDFENRMNPPTIETVFQTQAQAQTKIFDYLEGFTTICTYDSRRWGRSHRSTRILVITKRRNKWNELNFWSDWIICDLLIVAPKLIT